jgi:U4/U6.U5 tri-snRNP component SNU23
VREAAEKEEGKLRYEAKLAGKKYYAPLTGDETLTEARKSRLDVAGNVGKISLLPAGAATGKRGRGAGFYCEACDLTFKDNLQWVEVSTLFLGWCLSGANGLQHENSMQHLRAIGQTGEVKRASAEEVHERIERIWNKMEEERKGDVKSLQERLKGREEEDEKVREERKKKRHELAQRRREEREKEIKVKAEYDEDVRVEGEHEADDMAAMMGFGGFGTSKK